MMSVSRMGSVIRTEFLCGVVPASAVGTFVPAFYAERGYVRSWRTRLTFVNGAPLTGAA